MRLKNGTICKLVFERLRTSKKNFGGYMEVFSNEKGLGETPKPLVLVGAEEGI